MATSDSHGQPFPRQASARRRLLQGVVALIGWVLFVYWWWIVFGRVSRKEVVYSGIFVGLTTLITIVLAVAWAMHNKRLYRNKPPRNSVRPVEERYARDKLLRALSFHGGVERIKMDPVIEIAVEENRKVYRPGTTGGSR